MHITTGKGHPDISRRGTELDFRELLEALPAAAYTCDADGNITYFNRGAALAWGREPKLDDPSERYCGSWRLFTLEGEHIPHNQCWMAKCLQDRREYLNSEIVIERQDGSRRIVEASATPFIDDQGHLTGAINVVIDITDRKQIEGMLREREQRLAEELEAMSRMQQVSTQRVLADDFSAQLHEILDAAISITCADMGNIQLLDGGALRIAAQRGFEAPFLEFINSSKLDESAWATALGAGTRIVVEEVNSSPLFVGTPALAVLLAAQVRAVQSTPLTSRSGRRLGMFSTHYRTPQRPSASVLARLDVLVRQAADLIERCQAEEALRTADRKKDEFLAMLAHELRNPLAPIRNALYILRPAVEGTPSLQAVVQMMERQVNQMVRLIDDLMEVSRISRGLIGLRKERIEIASAVRNAVETSQSIIDGSGHQLEIVLPVESMVVDGDPVRLSQIISNLLNNAAKYTKRGGHIWLTVERQDDFAILSVRDSGIGISAKILPQVFDLFMQADCGSDAARSGLGIGLALVRTLTHMHGGAVEARSEGLGRGSEFVVRLPLFTALPTTVRPEDGSSSMDDPCSHPGQVVDHGRAAANGAMSQT